jgi:SAM-dependent methyltransferase
VWAAAAAYEPYVGRWSRVIAREFVRWLDVAPGARWVDVGCGTGALTETIVRDAAPSRVEAVDSSQGYVDYARARIGDQRAVFHVADASTLPQEDATADAVVSAIALNFFAEPAVAVREMLRVAVPDTGVVAAYVWDYAGRMELMRYFWDAAVELDASARSLDEGERFPLCNPTSLAQLFESSGVRAVEVRAIDAPTRFRDFDDYWSPFLGGQGPAPGYAMRLTEERRVRLRDRIRDMLPTKSDGSIDLIARAWAVRGIGPS